MSVFLRYTISIIIIIAYTLVGSAKSFISKHKVPLQQQQIKQYVFVRCGLISGGQESFAIVHCKWRLSRTKQHWIGTDWPILQMVTD